MSLTSSCSVSVASTQSKTADLSSVSDELTLETSKDFTSGTGADQADLVWHDQRTVAGGANDDIDLAGVLADQFGATLTFARIKAIKVVNLSASARLRVGPGGVANPWNTWIGGTTPYVEIAINGVFFLMAPGATAYAVTAGTVDKLRISNPDGVSADYQIWIIGASA